jgi:hypothetical protein
MSDLISREALLKVIRDDRLTNASDAIYFITNAPAVEQGEAVIDKDAYDGAREDLSIWKRRALEAEEKVRKYDQRIVDIGVIAMTPVTTPQQSQSIADALEEAAKICDDYANSNFGSLVDSGQNGAYVCSKAIRALIKRNAEGME